MTSSAVIGRESRPLRVAIVGAGPAGYYTAEALLKQEDLHCEIDILNRFPTPFGLVREGVAPDHQSIKAVTRIFDRISREPNVRFFGNVTFGEDVHLSDLTALYDQIVFAVGAQSDRKMGIPGEDLEGSRPATEFVGWYNGRPDHSGLTFDLTHERVVVVGNGNVAVDVARILLLTPDRLAETDIADHALTVLRESRVSEVVVLGRRGPAQAAFTSPELKEFGELEGVDVIVDPADLELDEESREVVENDRRAAKNYQLLQGYAEAGVTGQPRRVHFRFLVSPVEILGSGGAVTGGRVTGIRIEKNELYQTDDGALRPRGTGDYEALETGLVLRSVGYRGVPLPEVPFDPDRSVVRNTGGRVVDGEGEVVSGQYVVGWCKRGPSGIIGTNKSDAKATVAAMMEDLSGAVAQPDSGSSLVERLVARNVDYVTYEDWLALDAHECTRGEAEGRPRIKACTVEEMMRVVREARQVSSDQNELEKSSV